MKIEYKRLSRVELSEFADQHDLIMVCCEHMPSEGVPWFYAEFKNTEVKEGKCLSGRFGTGDTEGGAISDYCRHIQGQTLVVDAMGKTRREIIAPSILTYTHQETP